MELFDVTKYQLPAESAVERETTKERLGIFLSQYDNWMNLFSGTQELNQIYMVQYENEVANYLKNTDNHIRYRVTPIFRDRELLARAVQLEAQSIEDDEVQFNVLIYNVQNGFTIDYNTGKAIMD